MNAHDETRKLINFLHEVVIKNSVDHICTLSQYNKLVMKTLHIERGSEFANIDVFLYLGFHLLALDETENDGVLGINWDVDCYCVFFWV